VSTSTPQCRGRWHAAFIESCGPLCRATLHIHRASAASQGPLSSAWFQVEIPSTETHQRGVQTPSHPCANARSYQKSNHICIRTYLSSTSRKELRNPLRAMTPVPDPPLRTSGSAVYFATCTWSGHKIYSGPEPIAPVIRLAEFTVAPCVSFAAEPLVPFIRTRRRATDHDASLAAW